jgi:hypothetical protein
MRVQDAPPGWRAIKADANGGTTFRPAEEGGPEYRAPSTIVRLVHPSKPKPVVDWRAKQQEFYDSCTYRMSQKLGKDLGMVGVYLSVLGLGWCKEQNCWTFPMHSDPETVVGIRTRFLDGSKRSISGSSSGLFMVPNPVKTWPSTVLVCEGPTDTAAMLSLGFTAVGRPSCSGGTDLLKKLLVGRGVVIVSDSDEPGQRGAASLLKVLLPVVPYVLIITPPAKDVRAWVSDGATREDVLYLIREQKIKAVNSQLESTGKDANNEQVQHLTS